MGDCLDRRMCQAATWATVRGVDVQSPRGDSHRDATKGPGSRSSLNVLKI